MEAAARRCFCPVSAFFDLYESLPRQGPGDRETLDFTLKVIRAGGAERILDAGCGAGADIDGLLAWAPAGHVSAVDSHVPFVEQVVKRNGDDPRVKAIATDIATLTGPFDLIWSAGTLYFLGLEAGFRIFHSMRAPSGALVFSHPAYFNKTPSQAATDFWEGEGEVFDHETVYEKVRAAGYTVFDAVKLPDAAWEAYYSPLQARIDALNLASGDMVATLEGAQREIDGWRKARAKTGYLQFIAEPE